MLVVSRGNDFDFGSTLDGASSVVASRLFRLDWDDFKFNISVLVTIWSKFRKSAKFSWVLVVVSGGEEQLESESSSPEIILRFELVSDRFSLELEDR